MVEWLRSEPRFSLLGLTQMSPEFVSSSPADGLTTSPDGTDEAEFRRWRALPVILIGSFLAFLDFFIVNIALPAIQADLNARPAQLQFVVAAYGIGFGVFLITGGRLGDIFGHKPIYLVGLAGFTIASMLCAAAPTSELLIVSRVLQAIAAAALVPQVLAIIRAEFPADERPVAIGLYGASMGLASIVAQLVGGLLVSIDLLGWSWRPIFMINLPIGAAAILLASKVLRESRSPTRANLDLVGVGIASLALFLLIFPIVEGREYGWPAWSFYMLAALPAVLTGFVIHQRRVLRLGRTPLIALHLLQLASLRLGLALSVVFFGAVGVFFIVLTIFLQFGLGYSPLKAGLIFLPFALGFSASSTVSGPIAARIGLRIVNLGSFLMAFGLLAIIALARLSNIASANIAFDESLLIPVIFIYGLGQGLVQPALINVVISNSGVTTEDAGSAVGLFLTVAQSAIALGVAAIGDIFYSRLSDIPTAVTYLDALSAALFCMFVLQVATFVLALMLRNGRN